MSIQKILYLMLDSTIFTFSIFSNNNSIDVFKCCFEAFNAFARANICV